MFSMVFHQFHFNVYLEISVSTLCRSLARNKEHDWWGEKREWSCSAWLLFGKVFTKYRPELISAGDWYGVNMLQMCSVTKDVKHICCSFHNIRQCFHNIWRILQTTAHSSVFKSESTCHWLVRIFLPRKDTFSEHQILWNILDTSNCYQNRAHNDIGSRNKLWLINSAFNDWKFWLF